MASLGSSREIAQDYRVSFTNCLYLIPLVKIFVLLVLLTTKGPDQPVPYHKTPGNLATKSSPFLSSKKKSSPFLAGPRAKTDTHSPQFSRFAVAWIGSLHLGEYTRGGRFSAQSLGFPYQFFHRISLLLTEPRKKCWPAMGGGEDGGSCNLLQVLFGRGAFSFVNKDFRADRTPAPFRSSFHIFGHNSFGLDYAEECEFICLSACIVLWYCRHLRVVAASSLPYHFSIVKFALLQLD